MYNLSERVLVGPGDRRLTEDCRKAHAASGAVTSSSRLVLPVGRGLIGGIGPEIYYQQRVMRWHLFILDGCDPAKDPF